MTKLPSSVKAKKLVKALERLGFEEVGRRGSHIRLSHPDGRWTQVSVHTKPFPKGTLRAIVRQTGIPVDDLLKAL